MTDLANAEYCALRQTIRTRGGARPLAALAGVAVWAGTLVGVLSWLPNPLAAVVPLVVLTTTYEVVRSLHFGVERIGRYLQVFFEEDEADDAPVAAPAWERAAMQFGPTVPGAGVHPLFLPVFVVATVVNLTAVILPGPLPVEAATLMVPHLAFVLWMLYCERGMRQQRASDLARFRALKNPPTAGLRSRP